MCNIELLHDKYSHLIYGPDHLLKPLAILQEDLEQSGLPREDRLNALQLAALYWADSTGSSAPLARNSEPTATAAAENPQESLSRPRPLRGHRPRGQTRDGKQERR